MYTDKTIEVINKEIYPLFKVVLEETFRFRDVDSEIWLDSEEHELVRSGNNNRIYVKDKYGDDWLLLFEGLSSDPLTMATQIRKIKDRYDMLKWQYFDNPPVMFTYHNQVFKVSGVYFGGLRIAGKPIEPEKYYIEDNDSIVLDLVKSDYIFPHKKNTILFHAGNAYLNGELIETKATLKELGHVGYTLKDTLLNALATKYPEADAYESWMEAGPLNHKIREQV